METFRRSNFYYLQCRGRTLSYVLVVPSVRLFLYWWIFLDIIFTRVVYCLCSRSRKVRTASPTLLEDARKGRRAEEDYCRRIKRDFFGETVQSKTPDSLRVEYQAEVRTGDTRQVPTGLQCSDGDSQVGVWNRPRRPCFFLRKGRHRFGLGNHRWTQRWNTPGPVLPSRVSPFVLVPDVSLRHSVSQWDSRRYCGHLEEKRKLAVLNPETVTLSCQGWL